MELNELVHVARFLFSAGLALTVIVAVADLVAQQLKTAYDKLKRPSQREIGVLATQPAAANHQKLGLPY